MIREAIKNYNLLEIVDEETSAVFYGCDQDWYGSMWKRASGCGPSVVSNIISYVSRKPGASQEKCPRLMKRDFVIHMNEVWQYVTPSIRGIPTTTALCAGAVRYIAAKGLGLSVDDLKISEKAELRPCFRDVLSFLSRALGNDTPVAFLALDNGAEEMLESWHWVTLLAIEYEEDGSAAFADIINEGKHLRVDLHKWFHTTQRGGGFVSFEPRTAA